MRAECQCRLGRTSASSVEPSLALPAWVSRGSRRAKYNNHFLAEEEEARKLRKRSQFQVEEKLIDPILVAGIRMNGRYADCGPVFARLGKSVGRYIIGKPLMTEIQALIDESEKKRY